MHRTKEIRIFAALAVITLSSAPAAHADCTGLLARFNEALNVRDLSRLRAIEADVAVDADCGGRLMDVQRRRAAVELVLAQDLINKKAPAREYEALVVSADKPDVLWRAASMLGDLRFTQREFNNATLAYERAIETIKNQSKTPNSPSPEAIKQIVARASEARMLAANEEGVTRKPNYVSVAKDHRDGTIGGAMSPDIRGFKPVSIPLPIRFVTGSSKFSDLGALAAGELLAALKEQQPNEIALVGHTDERGDANYNMRLSQERAKALAAYLIANGIKAKIITGGKGKSEPIELTNSAGLTKEDIWSLNRRVVLKRN